MSHNTFGHLFRVTTFGESHGPALGCVVDGCPPNIPLEEADIQADLDKRRPGQSRFTTQRREPESLPKDSPDWLARVRDFRAMLEEHIRMEEEEVFPAFKQVMSEEQNAKLTSLMNKEGFKMA